MNEINLALHTKIKTVLYSCSATMQERIRIASDLPESLFKDIMFSTDVFSTKTLLKVKESIEILVLYKF